MLSPFASAILSPDLLALFATPIEDAWKGGRPFHGDVETHRAAFPEAYAPPTFTPATRSGGSDVLVPFAAPRSYTADAQGRIRTADRSFAARSQWALEAEADAFLRAAGDHVERLDITSRDERLPIVKPDAVAWRGAQRARVKPSVRYGTDETAVTDTLADGTRVTRYRTESVGRGVAWQGFTKGHVANTADVRAIRRARKAARPTNTGKRGKAVDPIALAPRSLPARWKIATDAQRAAAELIESILLASDQPGSTVTLTNGASIEVDRSSVRLTVDNGRTTTDTARQIARRCALAGLTLED